MTIIGIFSFIIFYVIAYYFTLGVFLFTCAGIIEIFRILGMLDKEEEIKT